MPSALGPRSSETRWPASPSWPRPGQLPLGRTWASPGGRETQRTCSHTSCCPGGPPRGGGSQGAVESRVVPLPPPARRRSCLGSLTLPRLLAGWPGDQPVPSSQSTRLTQDQGTGWKQRPSQCSTCIQPHALGPPSPLKGQCRTPGRSIRDLLSLRTPLEVAIICQGVWGWDCESRGQVRRLQRVPLSLWVSVCWTVTVNLVLSPSLFPGSSPPLSRVLTTVSPLMTHAYFQGPSVLFTLSLCSNLCIRKYLLSVIHTLV